MKYLFLFLLLVDGLKNHLANQEYITPIVKEQAEWMISIDLDEYVYAMPQPTSSSKESSSKSLENEKVKTIADALRDHPDVDDSVGVIYLTWTFYGSSGLIEQPASVRKGFWQCKPTMTYDGGKYMVRTSVLREIAVVMITP